MGVRNVKENLNENPRRQEGSWGTGKGIVRSQKRREVTYKSLIRKRQTRPAGTWQKLGREKRMKKSIIIMMTFADSYTWYLFYLFFGISIRRNYSIICLNREKQN